MSLHFAPSVLAMAEGGFNPMHFDPSAMLLTLITFLGLFFLLWKFAWGPILKMVEAREERIDGSIRQAETDREEARRMLADYTQRVADVESEVAGLREKGRTDAEAIRKEILDQAQADGAALAAKAERDIEQARSQAIADLRREAVDLGLQIATKVVGRSVDGEDQRRLADEVIASVGGVHNGTGA